MCRSTYAHSVEKAILPLASSGCAGGHPAARSVTRSCSSSATSPASCASSLFLSFPTPMPSTSRRERQYAHSANAAPRFVSTCTPSSAESVASNDSHFSPCARRCSANTTWHDVLGGASRVTDSRSIFFDFVPCPACHLAAASLSSPNDTSTLSITSESATMPSNPSTRPTTCTVTCPDSTEEPLNTCSRSVPRDGTPRASPLDFTCDIDIAAPRARSAAQILTKAADAIGAATVATSGNLIGAWETSPLPHIL
mmetsp:Transcript_21387/g.66301  ORF Transcript_21387/g.66301 Transcript_21387/m.66301 type:complete len:254 (-) Transcript_21387:111-872(-)